MIIMRRVDFVLFAIFILISSANAQDLKKAFKAYEKKEYHTANLIFKKISPQNSASEYGQALISLNQKNNKYYLLKDYLLIQIALLYNHFYYQYFLYYY